jgi:hypothetical protein
MAVYYRDKHPGNLLSMQTSSRALFGLWVVIPDISFSSLPGLGLETAVTLWDLGLDWKQGTILHAFSLRKPE